MSGRIDTNQREVVNVNEDRRNNWRSLTVDLIDGHYSTNPSTNKKSSNTFESFIELVFVEFLNHVQDRNFLVDHFPFQYDLNKHISISINEREKKN